MSSLTAQHRRNAAETRRYVAAALTTARQTPAAMSDLLAAATFDPRLANIRVERLLRTVDHTQHLVDRIGTKRLAQLDDTDQADIVAALNYDTPTPPTPTYPWD